MNIKNKILIFVFIFAGLTSASFVEAATCPTDNGAGVVCSGGTPYFCGSSCVGTATAPGFTQCTNYVVNSCSQSGGCTNAATTNCGYTSSCATGSTCGAWPNMTCQTNPYPTEGTQFTNVNKCGSWNGCTNPQSCNGCNPGYKLCGNSCTQNNCQAWETASCSGTAVVCTASTATVKLGSDSVLSDRLTNSTNPLMTILSSGFVGIGSSTPSTYLSFLTSSSGLINMGSGRITNLGDPIDDTDAVTKNYADDLVASTTSASTFWKLLSGKLYYNDGNVGIGTNNPAAKLDIPGSGTTDLLKIAGATFTSVAGSGDLIMRNVNQLRFQDGNDWDWNKWAGIKYDSTNTRLTIGGPASSAFNANANPPQIKIVLDGGNVGIGTTNPGRKLEVVGSVAGSGLVKFQNTDTTGYTAIDLWDPTSQRAFIGWGNSGSALPNSFYLGTDAAHPMNFMTSNAVRMTLDSSGNLGIGTSTPTQILSLKRTGSDNYIKVDAGGTGANYSGLMLSEDGINWGWTLRHGAASDNLFISYQDNTPTFTDAVTFTRAGSVGIATTTPNAKLNVFGDFHVSSNNLVTIDFLKTLGDGLVASVDGVLGTVSSSNLSSRYVTSTPLKYSGNRGSYTAANSLCAAVVTGSHVCSTNEILNTINLGHSADMPAVSSLWINNGPPGYQANANDCAGWTSSAATSFGTIWVKNSSFVDGLGSLEKCDGVGYAYACCK